MIYPEGAERVARTPAQARRARKRSRKPPHIHQPGVRCVLCRPLPAGEAAVLDDNRKWSRE